MAEAKKAAKAAKAEKEVKEAEMVVEAAPTVETPAVEPKTEEKATAKAGKRSAKAVREAEEKEAKEVRKQEASEQPEAAKTVKKPTRPKVERAGKKYREAAQQIDKNKVYSLAEALELATKTSPTKFDATVELHVNLGVDPRQADQNVRDNVILPEGTGKKIRVAALIEDDRVKEAEEAGADIAGSDKVFALLDKEQLDFDILVATPSMMPKLGKYARMLGPRGLMPNPKSGTVTTDIGRAVAEAKAGKVEYRVDQSGIVHLGIGKVSFGKDKLSKNAEAIIASIRSAKPAGLKGTYIKSATITTTMGPGIKVQL